MKHQNSYSSNNPNKARKHTRRAINEKMKLIMSNEKCSMNHSAPDTWVRICPRCSSSRIDLHLYGRYSQQLYKCIDCEYVGIDFIQVDLPTLEQLKTDKQVSQHEELRSHDNHNDTVQPIIEYCCPHCGQVCTEAEVQQGFCTACDQRQHLLYR
jgi:hypothetical protein